MNATARPSCRNASSSIRVSTGRRAGRASQVAAGITTPSFMKLHVRGFTKKHPAVPEHLRGTYRGPGAQGGAGPHQVSRRHLRRAAADPHLHQRQPSAGEGSHQLLGLQHASASSLPIRVTPPTARRRLREFKEMVARFHEAGLEVILDVVYNHTAEGNERGPTLSFKGIDNASYYRLHAGQAALLHQRHRHRQHRQPDASAGDPDGHRQPALLGATRCMSMASASISAPSWRASRTASTTRAAFSRPAARIRSWAR